jgi:anti-sigma regulatory factor (Ser/Thr protein kinase)
MGTAREYVRSRLGEVLPASKLGEIELLTTELVTNAIEHAPGGNEVGLEIDIRSESVRVSIIDAGPGFDLAAIERPREMGGWGLFIVDQVSDRWGIDGDPSRVWFEIDR